MNTVTDNTLDLLAWQRLVIKVQNLAFKLPEMGINPDKVVWLPYEDLIGILAFLRRKQLEKQRLGYCE